MMRQRPARVHAAHQSPPLDGAAHRAGAGCRHNAVMQFLRATRLMHRLLVLAYVLTLAVAAVAPRLQPPALDQVCAAGGLMTGGVTPDAGGDAAHGAGHKLDCALCTPVGPPQARLDPAAQPLPHADLTEAWTHAHVAGTSGAPLPPRGPPAQA